MNAMILAAGFVVWIVALRVMDGAAAPTLSLPVKAARWSLWLAAFPVALTAAHQRALADRRDGLEVLALVRGFSGRELARARVVAAALRIAWVIALPAALAGVASLASAGTLRAAADRALVLAVIAAYAVLAGLLLGPIAAVCEVLAPLRGRSLFFFVLVASWAIADLLDSPALSITGALGLAMHVALDAVGLGRIG
jgi:hypothetical protein